GRCGRRCEISPRPTPTATVRRPASSAQTPWQDGRVYARTIVIVEGLSDRAAVEALARRRGLDLAAAGVSVVPIGGGQGIGRFLAQFGPGGIDVRLAGLVDAGEERHFQRALQRAGIGSAQTRDELERLGFFVCQADLEDELIRALGEDHVVEVIAAQGEL